MRSPDCISLIHGIHPLARSSRHGKNQKPHAKFVPSSIHHLARTSTEEKEKVMGSDSHVYHFSPVVGGGGAASLVWVDDKVTSGTLA
jgi:hypothetical protein